MSFFTLKLSEAAKKIEIFPKFQRQMEKTNIFKCKPPEVHFTIKETECHIINYLLTQLARAVQWNIGLLSFSYGPRTRLVRGIYYMANPVLGKSLCSDWFFLGQDFAVRTVSMETVQSVYFCLERSWQIQNLHPKQQKKSVNNVILHIEIIRRS